MEASLRWRRWFVLSCTATCLLVSATVTVAQEIDGMVPRSEAPYAPASTDSIERYLLGRRECTRAPIPRPIQVTIVEPRIAVEGGRYIVTSPRSGMRSTPRFRPSSGDRA